MRSPEHRQLENTLSGPLQGPAEPELPFIPCLPGLLEAPPQPIAPAAEPSASADTAFPEPDAELQDWKEAMRRSFEAWLDDLDEIPELEPGEEAADTPDLYAFYAQWLAANAEARKGNRRAAEAFSQWGDALGRFDGDLKLLREQLQRLAAESNSGGMSRTHCLVLVELLERLRRVAAAFGATPTGSWWRGPARWRSAWASQRHALEIVLSHFESLLLKEGVTRIETMGQPFDPTAMTAVAVESDASRPERSILEELGAGYRLRGEVLRPAQVKVSSHKSPTIPQP